MSNREPQLPEDFVPLAREGEHIAPQIDLEAFHCPLCGVLAPMSWDQLYIQNTARNWVYSDAKRAQCGVCRATSYWVRFFELDENLTVVEEWWEMVRPRVGGGLRPHPQMPGDVRTDYEEARAIVMQSPRGACALLRFALQTLLGHLGQKGKKPDDAIAALVRAGLPVQTQQALDVLRVVGNNAVHPLELDLRDDVATATGLFGVINFIVQDRIAQPLEIERMFSMLPEGARKAIEKRDATTN